MGDKAQIAKAAKAQITNATIVAEMNSISKRLKDLSVMAEKNRKMQVSIGDGGPSMAMPKIKRRKKNKGGILATIGISLLLFVSVSAAPEKEKMCDLGLYLGSDSLVTKVIEAKSYDTLNYEPIKMLRDYNRNLAENTRKSLADAVKTLKKCVKPKVLEYVKDIENDLRLVTQLVGNIDSCARTYNDRRSKLASQNAKVMDEYSDDWTLDECLKRVKDLESTWRSIIEMGHTSDAHKISEQHKRSMVGGCEFASSWKEWGYLSNGEDEPCTKGLVAAVDLATSACSDKVAINVNAPGKECRIGHRTFGGSARVGYRYHVGNGTKSCSFGCFEVSEVYESMTNQPLCLSCLSPYLDILWDLTCFKADELRLPIAIDSIMIFRGYTEFSVNEKLITCANHYSFHDCCGGRGPSHKHENTLIDKYCVCSVRSVHSSEALIHYLVEAYHKLSSIRYELVLPFILLIGIYLAPHTMGLVTVFWLAYHLLGTHALCSVDNIVSHDAVFDQVKTMKGFKADFIIQSGQCVNMARHMLEVLSISKKHLYSLDKTVPFKTKITCAEIAWACWGGSEHELKEKRNRCVDTCRPGVVKTGYDKVPAFHTSGCAAFWEGVLLRSDVCMSIGSMESQARFYRHVSYEPVLVIKGILYTHGTPKGQEITLVEGSIGDGFTVDGVIVHHTQVPTALMKRGPHHLCSSVSVNFDSMCGSLSLQDLDSISADCFDIGLKWDATSASYSITYKRKDAEAIVHNYFHACHQDSNVTFVGYEAFYEEVTLMAKLTISAKRIDFAPSTQWCDHSKLKVESIPGMRGFRQSTHVEIASSESLDCKIVVGLPGCTSLQADAAVVRAQGKLRFEFYCHGNASAQLLVSSHGVVRTYPIKETNKNWMPLKTSLTNTVVAALLKTDPTNTWQHFNSWIGSLDLVSGLHIGFRWLESSWIRIAVGAFLVVVLWNSIIRGNILAAMISLVLLYLVTMTNSVIAIELDPSMPVSCAIKLANSQAKWFLTYNFVSDDILAQWMEVVVFTAIILLFGSIAGYGAMVFLALSIKFYTRYSMRMAYMDSIYSVGVVHRLPWINTLSRKMVVRKKANDQFAYDIFGVSEEREKFLRCAPLLEHSGLRLSSGDRKELEQVLPLIRCRTHAGDKLINVDLGVGYFAYEWSKHGLSLYFSDHVVRVADRDVFGKRLVNVYGDVYACTSRRAAVNAPDGDCPRGRITNGSIAGLAEIDHIGLSGYTLLSDGGSYYVIHEWNEGGLAKVKTNRANPPLTDVRVDCPVCHTQEAGCSTGPEVEERLAGGGEESDITTVAVETIHREKELARVDTSLVEEWTDAWGVKYDKIGAADNWGLRCNDVKLWARHLVGDVGFEIHPDILAEDPSVRCYGASASYCCVWTTVDGKKEYFAIKEKEPFVIIQDRIVKIVVAHTFITKKRLPSGLCVFVWYKGIWPSKENMKVTTIVTISRKVGDLYYYAIMNDTAEIYEHVCTVANGLPQIREVNFEKQRILSVSAGRIVYHEHKRYKNATLYRFLDAARHVLVSFELPKDCNVFDWIYHSSRVITYNPHTAPLGTDAKTELNKEDHVNNWALKIARTEVPSESPTRVPVIIVAPPSAGMPDLYFTVYIRITDVDGFDYVSGKFLLCSRPSQVREQVSKAMNRLWSAGVEIILVKGELSVLISQDLEPSSFFVGCQKRTNPVLILCPEDGNKTLDVEDWLKAELDEEERTQIVSMADISIHPDWISGSIALTPSANHSMTQRSLAEWRSHASYPVDELDFVGTDWAPVNTDDPCLPLNMTAADYCVGEIECVTSRASFTLQGTSLVTSYHATKGCRILLNRNGYSKIWDKPFSVNKKEDCVVYGTKGVVVEEAKLGEILCVVSPIRQIAQFLLVTTCGDEFETRPGAIFYTLRPIEIDELFTKWVPSSWLGVNVMSGCPIFNSRGRMVSVYGLGRIESMDLPISSGPSGPVGSVRALTVMAPDMRPEIVPDSYFKAAAAEVISSTLREGQSYYLVSAPTGTGKTISFTSSLCQIVPAGSKLLLLQPTVVAVVGAFNRLKTVLDITGSGQSKYRIKYVVGQQRGMNAEEEGLGPTHLVLMTYGKALMEVSKFASSYDYILMDEIHCLNDPTVLACDLELTRPNSPYKCIHLSATVGTTHRAFMLASHLDITETRFRIDETRYIHPAAKGDNKDDYFVLPLKDTGIRIEGFPLGFKVEKQLLLKGRVLFFMASRRDCERAVTYSNRHYKNATGMILAIHGGTTIDITVLPSNAWIFCTDVVGQSITIPGCRVVVDFLQEMKPSSRLEISDDSMLYDNQLKRRVIDEQTSRQRRGRTGRTNPGWYITPRGLKPVGRHPIDSATIAQTLLRLSVVGSFSISRYNAYYLEEIITSLRNYAWVLPGNLRETTAWKIAKRGLEEIRKEYNKDPWTSDNLAEKARLVIGVNGDPLFLYLSNCLSNESIEHNRLSIELSRTGTPAGDIEFYKKWQEFGLLCDTEDDRSRLHSIMGMKILSTREKVDLSEDEQSELFKRHIVPSAIEEKVMMRIDDELEEHSLPLTSTAMVSVAAAGTLITAAYWWLENSAERQVVRAAVMHPDQVISCCKYYYHRTVVDKEASSAVSDTVNYIRRRVGDVQDWLEKITGKREVTQSASLIISKISSQLTAYAAAIPAAWHIGLCPSLATLAGAGVVGGWYGSLEDVLGRTLAIVALMALNGAVAGMCPIPMAVSAVITQIVSFTVAGIAAARSPTYDPSGRRVSSPSRAWSLVFGSIAGFGLGTSIIAPLLAGGAGHQVIRTLSNGASYPATAPVSGMLGKTGIAVIQVKHLYLILVRLRGGQCGLDMVAPVFASLLTASAMDLPTVVTGVTIVIGLLIVRSSLSYLKYAVGSTARGVRSTDGRNPYIEDYFHDFDELALNILSAASIMANPASIMSVLIAWMADGVRNGSLSSRGFQESYRVYAGVPLAITIISEGLRWARAFQGGEENHSALHSLLFSIPSAIAAVCGVVYYANQPGFVDAIKNVWNASVGFLTSVLRTLIDVTRKTIANGLTWIGDQIGMGLFRGIPFCGRSNENGSLEMTEMILAIRPEPQVVNDWFHREWIRMSGLTLIQRMQYSRSLGVQESSGVVPPMSMQNYIKKTRQGVSCCWRARTDVPFDSIKITTADLASIVGHFSCGVSTQANSFSMKRNGFELTGEIGYNESIGVFWFQGVTSISSFAVGLIFKPVSDALDIFVIGFRLPSALLKRVLGALSASHPVISNILGSRVDYDLELLKQEIEGPLGLNRVGLDLSWNTTMTGVLLSGAALFAGGQFFESVLTMTTDSGAIPKTWLVQPDDFTRDEWSCTAYYILALYEAGAMSPILMSPMRATELPLQIFGDNPVMWRTITNWKSPVPAASNYRDMRGKTLVIKRDVRDADGSDVFLKGTSLGHITIDGNVSYKQQWIHAAYWCSISVVVRTIHGTEMSKLGGACHCNVEIDVPADEVTVNLCEVHRSYYTTSSTHGHPFKSSEYLRGKTSGNDISPKINRLLTEWYRVTGRDKKMQGPKSDIEPKKIKQGLLSRLLSGLSSGQQDIEHSEVFIDYFSRTIGDFVKDLFHKDNLAVQALSDLNKAHIARQFQEPTMETATVEVFQDARGLDDYLLGWDRPNKVKKPRWPWFQEVHAWPFKDTEITCNDIQRISERNNSLASRMNKKEWEKLKQVGRVILPKRVSEETGAYVSRGGFKMQQLYEADPDFFNDCLVFCDPTSGYGGFAEYLSTAFEKSTPRLYLLSTLQEKGHRVLDPTILGLRSNLRVSLSTGRDSCWLFSWVDRMPLAVQKTIHELTELHWCMRR